MVHLFTPKDTRLCRLHCFSTSTGEKKERPEKRPRGWYSRAARDSRLRAKFLSVILEEQGGTCKDPLGRCPFKHATLPEDMADLDHITRVEDDGSDEKDNLQVLCACCHAAKTRSE